MRHFKHITSVYGPRPVPIKGSCGPAWDNWRDNIIERNCRIGEVMLKPVATPVLLVDHTLRDYWVRSRR